MNFLNRLIKDLFTEVDNKTFDVTKVLAVASICTGIGLAIYSVAYKGDSFDYQSYGMGTAALFAGVGVALGMKKESNVE